MKTGICSRQDAKNAKFGVIFFLCALCVFARDIPTFGLRRSRAVLFVVVTVLNNSDRDAREDRR